MPRRQRTPSPSDSTQVQDTPVHNPKKSRHAQPDDTSTPTPRTSTIEGTSSILPQSSSTEGTSSNQPAGNFISQYELTLLRKEKDDLEDELTMLENSTSIKLNLLQDEVKKLKGLLDRTKKRARDLEDERKDLLELVEDQQGKISEVESLQEEVERLDAMNKLMWRRWKDCLINHPEIDLLEYP